MLLQPLHLLRHGGKGQKLIHRSNSISCFDCVFANYTKGYIAETDLGQHRHQRLDEKPVALAMPLPLGSKGFATGPEKEV